MAQVEYVGRVVNPLRDRRAGAELIARDGESLAIAGYLSTTDIEDAGGIAAEGVEPLVASSSLDVQMGGFAPGFNETNDQTHNGPDQGRADRLPDPRPAAAVRLPRRRRGVDPAADRRRLDRRHAVRAADHVGLHRHLALRPQHRHRAQPRPGGRLRVAAWSRAIARRSGATVRRGRRTAAPSRRRAARRSSPASRSPRRWRRWSSCRSASSTRWRSPALRSRCSPSVIAILVVPSLLALLGTRIDALSIRRGPAVSDTSDGWYRLARGVMRRPVAVALASSALLLAAAAPLLWTTLTGPSSEAVPPGQALLRGLPLPRSALPARRHRGGHRHRRRRARATPQLAGFQRQHRGGRRGRRRRALRARPRPGRLRQLRPHRTGAPRAAPRTRCTRSATSPRRPPRATLVSGNTAGFIDQKQSLIDHAPLVVGIICLTTLVLLFLLTGSVLLPIKTLLMNSLTLGATLGILVLAFQEGWLDSLARLHRADRDRGDQPGLPLRRHLRPRHRLRGAGHVADQRAVRPRRRATRRRSRSGSAAPAG